MENATQTSGNHVALADAVKLQSTMQRQLLSCRRLAAVVADQELARRLSELADDTEAQALVGF